MPKEEFEVRLKRILSRRQDTKLRSVFTEPLAAGMTGFWLAGVAVPIAPGGGITVDAFLLLITGTICAILLLIKRRHFIRF